MLTTITIQKLLLHFEFYYSQKKYIRLNGFHYIQMQKKKEIF